MPEFHKRELQDEKLLAYDLSLHLTIADAKYWDLDVGLVPL